jgi:hypothetical protein
MESHGAEMRKTSVYLTDGELAALRNAARHARRSQSELIREAVRSISSRLLPDPSAASLDEETEPRTPEKKMEWFTRQEELAIALTNARKSVQEISKELRLSTVEVLEVLGSTGAKLRYFSTPSPGPPTH